MPASPVRPMPPVAPPMEADVFDPFALGILDDLATVQTEAQAHAKSPRSRKRRRQERQKTVVGVLAAAVVILAVGSLLLAVAGSTPSEPGHSAFDHPKQEDRCGQTCREPRGPCSAGRHRRAGLAQIEVAEKRCGGGRKADGGRFRPADARSIKPAELGRPFSRRVHAAQNRLQSQRRVDAAAKPSGRDHYSPLPHRAAELR